VSVLPSQLLAKGAEACLYLEEWYGYRVVRKHRIPKTYRVPTLDLALRRERTIREARIISHARRAGVPTPTIFSVDPEGATIVMEYVEGQRLKELLPTLNRRRQRFLLHQVGESVARLHRAHICHGDLTTSNMLLHSSGKVYFVDFGLATVTRSIEDFGTDLHLFKQALRSTHYQHWENCFDAFQEGYRAVYGAGAEQVLHKIAQIESRGRYITERV